METLSQERGGSPLPPRTLEFRQAMSDFKTMFPMLDSDLIECVLRSNAGHVDSTIDQLLQLSQNPNRNRMPTRQRLPRNHSRYNTYDDSTDSEDSIPSELLDPPTSSDDDDMPVREPPPMYTPRAGDPAPNFFASGNGPVEAPISEKKMIDCGFSNGEKKKMKTYRDWNPPILGTLPDDFLRILPQQFMDPSSKERSKRSASSKNPSRSHRKETEYKGSPQPSFHPQQSRKQTRNRSEPRTYTLATSAITPTDNRSRPVDQPYLHSAPCATETVDFSPVPPPRPSKTLDAHRSRRIPSNNGTGLVNSNPNDNIEHGNLFIQPAAFAPDGNKNFHPVQRAETINSVTPTSHRQRHSNSSRSFNARTPQHHSSHSHSNGLSNSNPHHHSRRHSDFNSHRMVMVPNRILSTRSSEPNVIMTHNGISGRQSPSQNERRSHHHRSMHSYHRSHHSNSCRSPTFSRDISAINNNPKPVSSSSRRTRQRTRDEEEQYVEDCRLAILLQNEEFIRELKRNEEFLKALEIDRKRDSSSTDKTTEPLNSRFVPSSSISTNEDDIIPLPDPDAKYPHGSLRGNVLHKNGPIDPEKEDEKAFKENLKHMGKSAKKKFNEIAGKFTRRRNKSYKSMGTIDPVFANCDDNFDELPGAQT